MQRAHARAESVTRLCRGRWANRARKPDFAHEIV
jgi:hypothetical protein